MVWATLDLVSGRYRAHVDPLPHTQNSRLSRSLPHTQNSWLIRLLPMSLPPQLHTWGPWWILFREHPWGYPAAPMTSSYDSSAFPGQTEASQVNQNSAQSWRAHSWRQWETSRSLCAGREGGWGCMLRCCSQGFLSPITQQGKSVKTIQLATLTYLNWPLSSYPKKTLDIKSLTDDIYPP